MTYEAPIILDPLPKETRLRDLECIVCPECRRSATSPFVFQDERGKSIWICVKCYVYWRYCHD